MEKSKKVLVTGGRGFIGRQTFPFLLEHGFEVHATATGTSIPDDLNGLDIVWHKVDLCDQIGVERLFKKVAPSHLLHFAWYTQPGSYWSSTENFQWLQASLSLLQSAVKHGVKRVVMAGSCAEYDWDYGFCSEKLTPFRPSTLYGASKNSLRSMLDVYSVQEGLSAAWGGVFSPYGPHEHPSRLVPSVIRSILQSEPAKCSHGKQIRDFMHVEDVGAAFVALLESNVQGVVNIASGVPIAIKDVVEKIASILGRRNLLRMGALNASQSEPPMLVADVRRLTDEVFWTPKYDLDSGLKQTIDWWKANMAGEQYEN